MKNVYIIGAQSTGKTTLVNGVEASCKAHTNSLCSKAAQPPSIIREVARTVLKEKGFSRDDIMMSPNRTLQLQEYILEAQYNAEVAADAPDLSSWYICDRSGLDPIVYAKCFVGSEACAEMIASKTWTELEHRMKDGIVVLCEAGSRWLVDDGIRLMPNDIKEWLWIDNAFRELLESRGIYYSVIPKDMVDLGKRVDFVRNLIKIGHEKTSDCNSVQPARTTPLTPCINKHINMVVDM